MLHVLVKYTSAINNTTNLKVPCTHKIEPECKSNIITYTNSSYRYSTRYFNESATLPSQSDFNIQMQIKPSTLYFYTQ